MGRANKKYKKSLNAQIFIKLNSMLAIGESKKLAQLDGSYRSYIYSWNTYHTYLREAQQFAKYMKVKHKEVTTLKKAKKYAREYMEMLLCKDPPLSSYTLRVKKQALCKLFDYPESLDMDLPERRRVDIKRSRMASTIDSHFSERKNQTLVNFLLGTGLRRSEALNIRANDLYTIDEIEKTIKEIENGEIKEDKGRYNLDILKQTRLFDGSDMTYFVYVKNGKGGKKRMVPILKKYEDDILKRFEEVGDDNKLFQSISNACDVHSYRGRYCCSLYRNLCPKDIPKDDKYTTRKDIHVTYSKSTMKKVSASLGHSRISVIAQSYLYNL